MTKDDKHAQPGTLPSHHGRDRLLGVGHNGERVNNVTEANRFDIDGKKPWIEICLLSEDKRRILAHVFIANTRERPDVVLYLGNAFEVVSTRLPIPEYRQVMSLTAHLTPPEKRDTL